jgi:hypothetical protein
MEQKHFVPYFHSSGIYISAKWFHAVARRLFNWFVKLAKLIWFAARDGMVAIRTRYLISAIRQGGKRRFQNLLNMWKLKKSRFFWRHGEGLIDSAWTSEI